MSIDREHRHARFPPPAALRRHVAADPDRRRVSAAGPRPAAPGIPGHPEEHVSEDISRMWTGHWWSSGPMPSLDRYPEDGAHQGGRDRVLRGGDLDRSATGDDRTFDHPVVPQLRRDRRGGGPPVRRPTRFRAADRHHGVRSDGDRSRGRRTCASAMSATLIRMPRREVVGTTQIARTVTAQATDLESIALAFDDALGKVLKRPGRMDVAHR